MAWQALSHDPNSDDVLLSRQKKLEAALKRAPIGLQRQELFCAASRGRRVLDVGCVDHVRDGDSRGRPWLHGRLSEVAREVVGVDILDADIATLRAEGFRVECVDVSLGVVVDGGDYEVVVAGEVIEHVNDPVALLMGMEGNLAEGGAILVSTPNPYATYRVRLGRRAVAWENADHVTYIYPLGMLELAARAGLQVRTVLSCDFHRSAQRFVFAVLDTARNVAWQIRRRMGIPAPPPMRTAIGPIEWIRLRIASELPLAGETLVFELGRDLGDSLLTQRT